MATETEICNAIQSCKGIFYNCTGENHIEGERYGNPHIIFGTKNGHTMIHIWKTGGVQTDPNGVLPDWRSYHLSDIVLLRLGDLFVVEKTFNPAGKIYHTTLCSV